MDRLHQFLSELKRLGLAEGNCLGLFHLLIGRTISAQDGSPISSGATWRALAAALKRVRWDPTAVQDLGIDPSTLPPRDRERYWYMAIAQAQVDSTAAVEAGNVLAERLRGLGYNVSRPPKQEPGGGRKPDAEAGPEA